MKKKNIIFIILVPILCALIIAVVFYDRYQSKQFAKNFVDDTKEVEPVKDEPTNNQPLVNIYCIGDSTTLSSNPETAYPSFLQNNLAATVTTIGDSNINSASIAIKLGAIPIYTNNITIPSDTTPVTITLLNQNGQNQTAILESRTNIEKCTINNVEGSINYNVNTNTLEFTRSSVGDSFTISTLTPIQVVAPEIQSDSILILYTGSYENSVNGSLAAYQQLIIDTFKTDKYIIVSLTQDDRDATNNLLQTTFGEHYLDFRSYLLTSGLSDAGITPTSQDQANISTNKIPSSLLVDDFNGNEQYHNLLGNQLVSKLKSLGYINN